MSIMGCYPDKRAIENELGGKWELFFEETRDESGNVGLEWDKDFDDLPLRLNGILVRVTSDNGITTANTTVTLTVNNNSLIRNVFNTGTSAIAYINQLEIHHGLLDGNYFISTNGQYTSTPFTTFNSNIFIDFINSLELSISNVKEGSKIQIYVLRGV